MADPIAGPLSAVVDNTADPEVKGGLNFSPVVPYKYVSGGKNQVGSITPTAGMVMGSESSGTIKNNMQELLKKYQNPWDEFQSNMDDMVARTQLRPAEALRQRAEEKQQKESNIYNLKMQMANMDASQASAKAVAAGLGFGVPLAPPIPGQATAGTQGTQGTMAPTYIDMIQSLPKEQQPIAMAYLNGGYTNEFMGLVKENSLKKTQMQKDLAEAEGKSPEEQDIRRRQILKDAYGPQSYINSEGKTVLFTAPGAVPITMRPPVPAVTGTGTTGISPTATAYVESRGNPNAVSPAGARGVMQVMPNTQKDPGYGVTPARDNSAAELDRVGTDYHAALTKKYGSDTFGSLAYNMGPGAFEKWLASSGGDFKKLPAETQSYIGQVHVANALLNSGQPNIVTNTMGGRAPAVAVSAPGINTVSKEDVAMQQENLGKAQSAFIDTTYKSLSDSVKGQENDVLYANRVLEALNKGEYGPGTSIGQMLNQGMQALGFKLSPEEQDKYLRNLTIEQAKQQFVALGAKAAMGSQYTGKESENFAKTLAGINDPKEFIRTVYELKKAKALIDDAHKQFLEESPSNMMKANKEWKNSGIRERIMKETVTSFNKTPKETEKKAQASESAAKLPAGAPADAKVGTDASGKPGWFVVRGGKTLQWKP
jgi:hypothetical protein